MRGFPGIGWGTDSRKEFSHLDPISSLTFGCGSILQIRPRIGQKASRPNGIFWQFPGDAIVMWGDFQTKFEVDVPSMSQWKELAEVRADHFATLRALNAEEKQDLTITLNRLLQQDVSDVRYNFTLRLIVEHAAGCPALCTSGSFANMPAEF